MGERTGNWVRRVAAAASFSFATLGVNEGAEMYNSVRNPDELGQVASHVSAAQLEMGRVKVIDSIKGIPVVVEPTPDRKKALEELRLAQTEMNKREIHLPAIDSAIEDVQSGTPDSSTNAIHEITGAGIRLGKMAMYAHSEREKAKNIWLGSGILYLAGGATMSTLGIRNRRESRNGKRIVSL